MRMHMRRVHRQVAVLLAAVSWRLSCPQACCLSCTGMLGAALVHACELRARAACGALGVCTLWRGSSG